MKIKKMIHIKSNTECEVVQYSEQHLNEILKWLSKYKDIKTHYFDENYANLRKYCVIIFESGENIRVKDYDYITCFVSSPNNICKIHNQISTLYANFKDVPALVDMDFSAIETLMSALRPRTLKLLPLIDNKPYEFNIKEDITALEAAHIAIVLAMCNISGVDWRYDISSYIKEHNLIRHFKEVQN